MRRQQRPIALLVTALTLGGCSLTSVPASSITVPTLPAATATPPIVAATYRVQRGEVADVLQLKGRVSASLDQDVLATTSGFVQVLYVKRNDSVSQGQILAELDIGALPKQLEQARADLQTTTRTVQNMQRQRSLAIDSARIQLQNAQANLERLQQPPSSLSLMAGQEKIDRARINLVNSRNALSATKTNAEMAITQAADNLRNAQHAYSQVSWANGNRPLDQLNPDERFRQEQAERALAAAERGVQSAQIAYDLAVQNEIHAMDLAEREIRLAEQEYAQLLAPVDPFDLQAAERAVASARISLQTALAGQDDPSSAARIEQLQNTIAELEQEVAESKLYAPFDGTVAEIGVQIGDQVSDYDAIMNVVDPSRLVIVVADIGSADLARIAPKHPVAITLDRYPEASLEGQVERLPSSQTAPGSMVRADPLLRISFDPGEHDLTIGDIAEIAVTFRREQEALWLPPQALHEFDQRTFVVLQEGDTQRQVDVAIGIRTPERVQILTGLQEGDTVVEVTDLTTVR